MEGLRAVSMFSGCGGFCEGIELAGFKVLAAVEKDRFAAETYRKNFPGVRLLEGDAVEFLKRNSETASWVKDLKNIDLLFGGPPCQGFSQIGTRDIHDERNSLYKEFVRVLGNLRPKMFLMENVPNLLLMRGGYFRQLILRDLRRAGYSNATVVSVLAADFGVPQLRRRAIFVGTRDDLSLGVDLADLVQATLDQHKGERHRTVREAIGDLPESVTDSGQVLPYPPPSSLCTFQRLMRLDTDTTIYPRARKNALLLSLHAKRALYNHHTKEILARRLALIRHLEPGKKANSLPKKFWDGLRPEKWRRLDPDAPSHTVLAQMHRDLSEFVHPTLDRWITVREAARLQSFHDGFIFYGSEWQQLKQIGNAVPPLLARALGVMVQQVIHVGAGSTSVRTKRREVQGLLAIASR